MCTIYIIYTIFSYTTAIAPSNCKYNVPCACCKPLHVTKLAIVNNHLCHVQSPLGCGEETVN
jgi:hypothetical protein